MKVKFRITSIGPVEIDPADVVSLEATNPIEDDTLVKLKDGTTFRIWGDLPFVQAMLRGEEPPPYILRKRTE